MGVNKVYLKNEPDPIIDLSNDSVSPSTLLMGETAHDKAGNPIIGELTRDLGGGTTDIVWVEADLIGSVGSYSLSNVSKTLSEICEYINDNKLVKFKLRINNLDYYYIGDLIEYITDNEVKFAVTTVADFTGTGTNCVYFCEIYITSNVTNLTLYPLCTGGLNFVVSNEEPKVDGANTITFVKEG